MFFKIEAKDDDIVIINIDDISHIYKNNNGVEIHFKNKECMSFTASKERIDELLEYICNELEVKE